MGNALKERVQRNAVQRGGDPAPAPGTAVATVAEKKPATLAEQLEQSTDLLQQAMPKGTEAAQLVRDVLHLMEQAPDLARCEAKSVMGGVMTFAQLGLRPGVLGHGWLLPFKRSVPRRDSRGWVIKHNGQVAHWDDVYQAQIVIGYKGYAHLTWQSPVVAGISGHAVFEHDTYEVEYGTNPHITHRKPKADQPRGELVGYYAAILLGNGKLPLFHDMTVDELMEYRETFAMGVKREYSKATGRKEIVRDKHGVALGDGPWWDMRGPVGWRPHDQMCVKTCFLQAERFAPKGLDPLLARAVEVDGGVRLLTPRSHKDPDEMLDVEHPTPATADIVDGEVVDPPPRETVTVTRPTAAAPAPAEEEPAEGFPVEFPAIPGDGPRALQSQTRKTEALLRGVGVTDPDLRRAVLGRLAGMDTPPASALDMGRRQIGVAQALLEQWETAGTLAPRIAKIRAALAGVTLGEPAAAPAETVPGPDDQPAWHDAGHPLPDRDRVKVLLTGDCGICEEAATG